MRARAGSQTEMILVRPASTETKGGMSPLSSAATHAMHRAGRAAAHTLKHVGAKLAPGMSTADIGRWVREDPARGGTPSQLGTRGLPHAE